MHLILCILALAMMGATGRGQEPQPLEKPYTPFDFDNYRRTPMQARQTSSIASKEDRNLQTGLISGQKGRSEDISQKAASMFRDPEEIPMRQSTEPLPSRAELTDELADREVPETTKGQKDLLARGRAAKDLGIDSMSESDYQLYVAQVRSERAPTESPSKEGLLRPMPTLVNSKTGGPPHGSSVSQAGVGARTEPRDNQNPFEDVARFLGLDHPVTKGNDPLPAPSSRPPSSVPIPAAVPEPVASPTEKEEAPQGAGSDTKP